MKVLPSGGSSFQNLSLTMPAGVTAAQMQYMGKAIGNIMSADGGALYLFPSGATAVAKIIVKNGVQASASSITTTISATEGQCIAQPLTNDINSEKIAVRNRNLRHFYHNANGEFEECANNGISSTQGGVMFTLGSKLFAVEPKGTSYCDGFQIVNVTNNAVVATHD